MKKKSNVGKIVAIGAGVTALAAAGYFLFGPDSKKNIHKVKGWMIKMKGEVVEKMEEVKDVTEPVYHGIVDSIAKNYIASGKVSKAGVSTLAKELKSHWKSISKSSTAKAKKAVNKVAKKVVKKTNEK